MQKRVGIAGFGIVGKSVLRFFQKKPNISVSVWDERQLSPEEQKLICASQAVFIGGGLKTFFDQNDIIIPSPGLDLRPYKKYHDKFVNELDLFAQNFSKQTIAITGTLGKTSITRMLGELLPGKTAIAGNIGHPMLDLIAQQNELDTAILELSSFQTEQNKLFVPDIALWTNFYPNHLDRHGTIEGYFDAKWRLFARQKHNQKALFPVELGDRLGDYQGACAFVCENKITKSLLQKDFLQEKTLYFVENKICYKAKIVQKELANKAMLNGGRKCAYSFIQNVLFVLGVFDLLGKKPSTFVCSRGAHRLEHFTTINEIDFYNDSKATVMQATQAAVGRLAANNRPIILIVGGQDKGVDRTQLVRFIAQERLIKKIFYLGCGCKEFGCYEQYASLDDLVHAIMQTASSGDQVLFSPSGASFDLFACFEERGDLFKKTVQQWG